MTRFESVFNQNKYKYEPLTDKGFFFFWRRPAAKSETSTHRLHPNVRIDFDHRDFAASGEPS